MSEESELLRHRFLDLGRLAEKRNTYVYSAFLGLAEQDIYRTAEKDLCFIPHELYGGSEIAERRIVVFGSEEEFGYPPDYPILLLRITPLSDRFSEELLHRDYLGAILALGIERERIGDILIRGKEAFLFALPPASELLVMDLREIRHTAVRCELLGKAQDLSSTIPELRPTLRPLSINIASERLDSIVAGFTGISRSQVAELFAAKRVFVNGSVTENYSKGLKEGDILTVRGFGRARYDGISGTSKKGRLYVVLQKYT